MARTFRKDIRQPDALQTHGRKVVLWFIENQKILYVGLGVVILVAAVFVGYRMWNERAREKASLAYGLARIASPDGQGEAAEAAYQKVADEYPRSRPGLLARLHLAALLRDRKEYQGARAQYELVAKSSISSETDQELAKRGIASVLMLEGACAEAIPIWESILNKGSLLTSEDLYIATADCQEKLGRAEDARKTYEELSKKHPESPFLTEQIRAKLGSEKAAK
ncbi:MAG: tetratricopeptide repeat protein [Nitrospinae bacterium]|nr:tetratricopeptide repeat protein [Nitrospinota bacterium]